MSVRTTTTTLHESECDRCHLTAVSTSDSGAAGRGTTRACRTAGEDSRSAGPRWPAERCPCAPPASTSARPASSWCLWPTAWPSMSSGHSSWGSRRGDGPALPLESGTAALTTPPVPIRPNRKASFMVCHDAPGAQAARGPQSLNLHLRVTVETCVTQGQDECKHARARLQGTDTDGPLWPRSLCLNDGRRALDLRPPTDS